MWAYHTPTHIKQSIKFGHYNIPSNIYDLGNWKNIDTKLRDLLVERGSIRDNDIIFPRGDDTRHFLLLITLEYYQMGRSMIENG